MIQRAGQNRHPAAASPQTAVGDHGAQPLGVGLEQIAVQPAEDDAVGVEDVDQTGEPEAEAVDEFLGRVAYGRVVVLRTQQ